MNHQAREWSAIGLADREKSEENEAIVDLRQPQLLQPLPLKTGEVARLLGLSRSTVFALLAGGDLPVVRIGRAVRVPRTALERWIQERTDPATSPADVQGPAA